MKRESLKIRNGSIVCATGGNHAARIWFAHGHPLVSVPYFLLTFDADDEMFPQKPHACPHPFCYDGQAFGSVDPANLESPTLLHWFALGGVALKHSKLTPLILGHDDSTPAADFGGLRSTGK